MVKNNLIFSRSRKGSVRDAMISTADVRRARLLANADKMYELLTLISATFNMYLDVQNEVEVALIDEAFALIKKIDVGE